MPARNTLTEKKKRQRVHDPMRAMANKVADVRAVILSAEKKIGLPSSPFDDVLGTIEEYYNQVADEFDDHPDGPPLQSLDAAYNRARTLHHRVSRHLPDIEEVSKYINPDNDDLDPGTTERKFPEIEVKETLSKKEVRIAHTLVTEIVNQMLDDYSTVANPKIVEDKLGELLVLLQRDC